MKIVRALVVAAIVISILPVMGQIGLDDGQGSFEPNESFATVDTTVTTEPNSLSVRATKGNALAFDGSDTVTTRVDDVANGSWTVCSAGGLNASANRAATYDVVAFDNATILLQYDAGNWSVYYENRTGADAKVTIGADAPTGGMTPVCGRYKEGIGLSLMANGTITGPTPLDNETETRNVSVEWYGRLDEVRVFGNALNDTQLQQYAADPIRPLPESTRLARLMFDEGSGTETTVYFASRTATIQGASWSAGVAGPTLERGSDYEIETGPLRIRVPAGSYLAGAPIAYASWSYSLLPFDFSDLLMTFAALLLLVYLGNQLFIKDV